MASPTDESSQVSSPSAYDGELDEDEIWWRDHQVWLEQRGYLLRPRYRPGWVPSWINTDRSYLFCEDGRNIIVRAYIPSPTSWQLSLPSQRGHVLDATRVADGIPLTLKRILTSRHPHEVEISRYLSSEPLASDPKNHCVPILEVLEVPNEPSLRILVMPLLRKFNDPTFLTVGEAIEFFRQVFEVCLPSNCHLRSISFLVWEGVTIHP